MSYSTKMLKKFSILYEREIIIFINKYPNKPWDWSWISENENITMDMIETYHTLPWDWKSISRNPNLTLKMIEKNPTMPWNWS